MKAVTIHQPWAGLIVDARRKLEIRKWNTLYRGPLLIHAGLKVDAAACARFKLAAGAVGAIIGMADVITTKQLSEECWERFRSLHLETGPWPYGKNTFAWFLANQKRFTAPIPCKGRLGLFDVPDGILPQRKYKVLKNGKIIESVVPGRYAGHKGYKIFGRLDCKSGMNMKKENRVFFLSWTDAIAEGYRPCKNCNPTPHD